MKQKINELDWKTYANASKEAKNRSYKQGKKDYLKLSHKFDDKAANEFNNNRSYHEYGSTKDNYEKHGDSVLMNTISYPPRASHYEKVGLSNYQRHDYSDDMDNSHYSNSEKRKTFPNRLFNKQSKKLKKAYKQATDEYNHYKNNDYEYQNGNGWKLKNENLDKMKPNKVRLTESQFYDLIKECTKRALNELHWKTYDSAARNSANRAGTIFNQRTLDFGKARDDAFNRDYGYKNDDNSEYLNMFGGGITAHDKQSGKDYINYGANFGKCAKFNNKGLARKFAKAVDSRNSEYKDGKWQPNKETDWHDYYNG